MPNYNRGQYIKEAIDSVLGQTYSNFELIVIDDGSEDNSHEILKSYNDPRFSFICQPNSGIPAKVRNKAINMAKGNWICFLDSDDFWEPNKLQEIENYIQNNHNENLVGIGHYEQNYHGEVKGNLTKFRILDQSNAYLDLLFHGNALSTSTMCVKKEPLFKVSLFTESKDYFAVEDYDLWLKLSQIGEFGMIKKCLSGYRIDDGNISGNALLLNQNLKNVVLDHIRNLDFSSREKSQLALEHSSRIDYYTGRSFQKDGLFFKAIPILLSSIKKYPFHLKKWVSLLFALLRLKY